LSTVDPDTAIGVPDILIIKSQDVGQRRAINTVNFVLIDQNPHNFAEKKKPATSARGLYLG
jgi:hypothetical protein